MYISFKQYLQLRIYIYKNQVRELKAKLRMAEKIANEEEKNNRLTEIHKNIQYNLSMIYAEEIILKQI